MQATVFSFLLNVLRNKKKSWYRLSVELANQLLFTYLSFSFLHSKWKVNREELMMDWRYKDLADEESSTLIQ